MNPKISVLMPVYNGEKYVKQAIDTVLSQTFRDFELVIVDNASEDKTRGIVKSYKDPRIILIENETNKGLIGSLNIGLARCRGKYIARLDHDDIALPQRLANQYRFMEEHPEIDLVGSWTECIDTKGNTLKISRNAINPIVIKYEFLFNNVMFHSSIFFGTELIKRNGGYSQEFVHSEDYEMYSRPGKELRCSNIPEVLFKLRIHDESITGNNDSQQIVHKNALNVAYRNMTQYIELPRQDFDIIKDILIIKKPDPKVTFKTLLSATKILKKITATFIKKNKLSKEDLILIMKSYKGRKWMMCKHYLIARYHELF